MAITLSLSAQLQWVRCHGMRLNWKFLRGGLLSEASVFASLTSYTPSVGLETYALNQIAVVLWVIKANLQEAMHFGRKSELYLLGPSLWHFRKFCNTIKMGLNYLLTPKYSCFPKTNHIVFQSSQEPGERPDLHSTGMGRAEAGAHSSQLSATWLDGMQMKQWQLPSVHPQLWVCCFGATRCLVYFQAVLSWNSH